MNLSFFDHHFIHRHNRHLKAFDWVVFGGKILSNIKITAKSIVRFTYIIVSLPLVLLLVAIKPLILIRFGIMMHQRIGHFAGDTEAYLCERDCIKKNHRSIDIIGCFEPVCNNQLKVMWKRNLHIFPCARLWAIMDRSCAFWTKGNMHHIKLYDRGSEYCLFSNSRQHLHFTDEEHQRGQELLKNMGIPEGSKWICIHNRDSAFMDKTFGGQWAYHDYRDFSIHTMSSASDMLSDRGYYVIRVGSIVEEALTSSNFKIIDYANSQFQCDFLDIYLLAHCTFFLGNDSGIWTIPLIFRRPLVMVNFTLLSNFFEKDFKTWFFIPKHFWHRERQKFLSLQEIFDADLASANQSSIFIEAGVELICNTPEEIRDISIEVEERLKSQWQSQPEDEKLQQRFWNIFRLCALPNQLGDIHVRIGTSFLRNNTYLLD